MCITFHVDYSLQSTDECRALALYIYIKLKNSLNAGQTSENIFWFNVMNASLLAEVSMQSSSEIKGLGNSIFLSRGDVAKYILADGEVRPF